MTHSMLENNVSTLLSNARKLRSGGQPQACIKQLEAALESGVDSAELRNTLGAAYVDLKQFDQALAHFDQALQLKPGFEIAAANQFNTLYGLAMQVHAHSELGDVSLANDYGERIRAAQRDHATRSSPVVSAFSHLAFSLTPAQQRAAAEAEARFFLAQQPLSENAHNDARAQSRADGKARLRIGYLSADFRNNAMAHLIADLFSAHDDREFEIFALSTGPNDGSLYRRRIERSAEHFIDLRRLGDDAAAQTIADLKLDVLVDLMGMAANHRAGILARQPAPVQVCWLGYCLTTGAPWIDFYLGDNMALPPEHEGHFSEQIKRIPDCYQIYSGEAPGPRSTRADWNLPDDATVLAAMHGLFKVDDRAVALWSQILSADRHAVLWLWVLNEQALTNMRQRFAAHHIEPERVIGAYSVDKPNHIERLSHADLFLDALLCNGHTSASDALWAGVPVLTIKGDRFATRVAASVCRAAGLDDLIVDDTEGYVQTAHALINQPQQLQSLRNKLKTARSDCILFDVPSFARKLETVLANCAHQPTDRANTPVEQDCNRQPSRLPLIVVLGQWRSGTSALAGALSKLGVYFGDELAQLEGPVRHTATYENLNLVKLMWRSFREPDMAVLREQQATLDELRAWLTGLEQKARTNNAVMLGIKHPALTQLVDHLPAIWPEVVFVRTDRSIEDSLESMQRAGWQFDLHAMQNGLEHQRQATQSIHNASTFEFPGYLAEAEHTVDRLIHCLAFRPSAQQIQAAIAFLSPNKNHS